MKIITIEVEFCEHCLHYSIFGNYPDDDKDYCMIEPDETIEDIKKLPPWCPLLDAPINAGENCFHQGGHGCNNIRLDVPWKD